MNFLNLPAWKIVEVIEEATHFFVRAEYNLPADGCPKCTIKNNCRKNGMRERIFVDAPIHGKPVKGLLTVQSYNCRVCGKSFNQAVPEMNGKSRLTKRLTSFIEWQSLKRSFAEISSETGISSSTVREIFTRFVEKSLPPPSNEVPRVMGIDEVYVNRIARCIVTDIENRRIIELLPKRDMLTVFRFLLQMENKHNLQVVAMDMWAPYREVIQRIFPDAEIVVDTFHVRRKGNQAINAFLRKFRARLSAAEKRSLLHDRFILMKRPYNLKLQEKEILKEWIETVPQVGQVYRAKEGFLSIWQLRDRQKAEEAYAIWRDSVSSDIAFAFRDIFTSIGNWHREIFNYFDFRVTNAFTESSNNLIKLLQRNSRGCSFEVIRIKTLYRNKRI